MAEPGSLEDLQVRCASLQVRAYNTGGLTTYKDMVASLDVAHRRLTAIKAKTLAPSAPVLAEIRACIEAAEQGIAGA